MKKTKNIVYLNIGYFYLFNRYIDIDNFTFVLSNKTISIVYLSIVHHINFL